MKEWIKLQDAVPLIRSAVECIFCKDQPLHIVFLVLSYTQNIIQKSLDSVYLIYAMITSYVSCPTHKTAYVKCLTTTVILS